MPIWLLFLLLFVSPLQAENPPPRQAATLSRDYKGAHQSEFASEFDRVRLLTQQAQLEVSARLGLLQYREGFQYPINIRFEDNAPPGLESALAYVGIGQLKDGRFAQELVVNISELLRYPMDFDTVFYHEMTHAVMNDAVGGEASMRLPHWLQEGLAVYVSGEGDQRVERMAKPLHKREAARLVFDLNGPVYGAAYPQYYLAIKYILDNYSINGVQGLVRNLIAGRTLEDSLRDSLGLSWAEYQQKVRDYSLRIFQDLAIPDHVTR